jgi:hypothetical protein
MLSRKGLIDYILENGSDFSNEELQLFPLTTLVLIKVQIELTLQHNKN